MACTNSTLFLALCDLHQFLDLESYCGHNKLKIFQICPN
ncbi:hypothetical protein OIU77_003318 [Salix suchowensis]|uniref:Uncharacterized protein n=1 Tax=Salix suchowensis TaxID=1278906 RepID=A0ABQ9AZE5_9ROSI|nr:hypothetical protein OIU77_003318 [Salix suchowensis]